ncbi:MAG TPA: hypothetical protein VK934_00550 [Fimbriimonas sp.]|nr:hypothetical protein [Fimbriimonas sp.]
METLRISGIEVTVDAKGGVFLRDEQLGHVGREERLGQFFWRAYPGNSEEPLKRFLTTRPEAIQLLLINADIIDGIGF